LRLQQEHVVRIEMRPDAAAGRRVADHDVVEPRIRNEREASQQRIRAVVVQVHALHEQRPVRSGQLAQLAARERAMRQRIAVCVTTDEPRGHVVTRGEVEQRVARQRCRKIGDGRTDEQRLLVPVARKERGRRVSSQQSPSIACGRS